MKRRRFLRLLGEGIGAASLEIVEPWELAGVLEPFGGTEAERIENLATHFARAYPSTPPLALAGPVQEQLRNVVRLLDGPQSVTGRRRLCMALARLAGLAGSLSLDLDDASRIDGYFDMALQAALESEHHELTSWLLAIRSLIPANRGEHQRALQLVEGAEVFAAKATTPTRRAWLAALRAKAAAGVGDVRAFEDGMRDAERALEQARPDDGAAGVDFFDPPRLDAFKGTALVLLHRPEAAQPALAQALARRDPSNVKGLSLARLDLAISYAQQTEVEEACRLGSEAMAISPRYQVGPVVTKFQDLRRDLEPWSSTRFVRALDEQLANGA